MATVDKQASADKKIGDNRSLAVEGSESEIEERSNETIVLTVANVQSFESTLLNLTLFND